MPSNFLSLGVGADLVDCLQGLGISEPYPIQSATLPDALVGHDLLAQSPTGSGKTLAFALPLVTRIQRAQPHRPRGLVLAPTRELAAQITETIRPLARVARRRAAAFYGGSGYKPQLDALRSAVDVVVGCPGRLVDLRDRGALHLGDVEVVVIDEADRMADMGFLPVIRRLLDEVRGEHQTMLFSATLTTAVERLVRDYQDHPRRHVLARPSDDLGSRTHELWAVPREERTRVTAEIVAAQPSSIVFCRTKRGADRLTRQLAQAGVQAVAIHGDRSQAQRDRALEQFRARRARVLVATDVASRGIHVERVDCVVHFDLPEDQDAYVHRSGRTGRAGAFGKVVSLVCPEQERGARLMAKRLGLEARIIPPSVSGGSTAGSHQVETAAKGPELAAGRVANRARVGRGAPAATSAPRGGAGGRRADRRPGVSAPSAASTRTSTPPRQKMSRVS